MSLAAIDPRKAKRLPLSILNLTGSGKAERLQGIRLSANAFELLGIRPPHTYGWSGAAPVVVLSHALWMRRFGGAANAIGTRVLLNGDSFLIVGVLPADFLLPKYPS